MKKIMIAILLLIPILIILTISASGLLIASAFVDIPAESIRLKHSGEEVTGEEIILEEQNALRKYTLICDVFPGIATDEFVWESSDPKIAKVTPSKSRKDAAEVEFLDYGSVDITCTSKKNTSVNARATFYVTGRIPGYLLIGDYEGETFSELSLRQYETKSLLASVKPAVSVRAEKVQWSSSDESVVRVDNNGVVQALSEGNAVISATVTASGKTVSNEVNVRVSGTALLKESVLYTTASSLSVSECGCLADEDATAEGGGLLDLSHTPVFGAMQVKVKKGDREETLTVVKVASLKTLVIENIFALKSGALSNFLSLGTSNVELRAVALDGSSPAIRWMSTNTDVADVLQGRIYAKGSGEAEIYAEAEGYASQRVTVNVTSTVDDFRLSETEYMDKVGLLQERVFGNVSYINGTYTKRYALTVRSYPEDVGIESYTFDSTNKDVATVDSEGVVTFADDVDGESCTITATAYNQDGLPVRRSYTFNLVNGVNVGVGVPKAHFDASKGEKPSFAPYWDLRTVLSDASTKGVVLHTDVYYPAKADGGAALKNVTVPIYGNGNKLDGQFFMESVEFDEMLLLWDFSSFTKETMPASLDVTVSNLNMQATQPTTEDSKETFEELSHSGGGAISLIGNYPDPSYHMSLTVKGCLFQYAYSHINVAIGDIFVDGCILRNNAASAIVLQESDYCRASAKIKNCIFSHTIAPVVIACGNFDEVVDSFSKNKNTNAVDFGFFEFEGENYVYNWKKLDEVQMNILPQKDDETVQLLVASFSDFLGTVIREAFKLSDEGNFYVDKDGETWLNFSFLVIGIWQDMNPHFNESTYQADGLNVRFNEKMYAVYEVHPEEVQSISKLVGKFKKIIDIEKNKTYHIVSKDAKGHWNTMPGENYEIDDTVRARLMGERV